MASLRYLWIVESRAGLLQHWITKGKIGPMPDEDGFIHLGKKRFPYAVDPRKFRRWTIRMGLIIKKKHLYQVQIWKENDANPLDFFHVKFPDPKFTSSMISTMAKSKRLNKIISGEQFDIIKLALILSLMMNIGIMIWLASQVIHP